MPMKPTKETEYKTKIIEVLIWRKERRKVPIHDECSYCSSFDLLNFRCKFFDISLTIHEGLPVKLKECIKAKVITEENQ